jgi:hypothetical protein
MLVTARLRNKQINLEKKDMGDKQETKPALKAFSIA